jgi:hypothetical protein
LAADSIWRDIGMYLLATITIIVFAIIGELTIISAVVMFAEVHDNIIINSIFC